MLTNQWGKRQNIEQLLGKEKEGGREGGGGCDVRQGVGKEGVFFLKAIICEKTIDWTI